MNPIFIHLGSKPIYWYGVMMASAFLSCMYIWSWLAVKDGRPKETGSTIAFWIMLTGIIGARVGFIFSEWDQFAENPVKMLFIREGGLIFYGGLIGASLAITVVALAGKHKLTSYYDLAIAAVPFGHALGRIGCFLNGCCWGSVTTAGCAVNYPIHSPPYDAHLHANLIDQASTASAPVHAVQLYEAALSMMLFAILIYLFPRRKKDGTILAIYAMGYGVIRFVMEFFRGDVRNPVLAEGSSFLGLEHLDVAQFISICIFTLGLILWIFFRSPREPITTDT